MNLMSTVAVPYLLLVKVTSKTIQYRVSAFWATRFHWWAVGCDSPEHIISYGIEKAPKSMDVSRETN